MKRIEVRLALPMVAPLLDVIRELSDSLRGSLAAPLALKDLDAEFRDAWVEELIKGQVHEVEQLLALFDDEFFREGVVAFDEDNAETIVRACAAVRLKLREMHLAPLGDETLETGEVDLLALADSVRKPFMCYLFLATIQELIIQHLDEGILGE
ncbi:MAG: hypothetical protein HZC55_13805 [Verrucomicrobia bacterium]|jgi:hypothetical protein|nr:hypothetical protein [Verrucomicrobiota bacterium]